MNVNTNNHNNTDTKYNKDNNTDNCLIGYSLLTHQHVPFDIPFKCRC